MHAYTEREGGEFVCMNDFLGVEHTPPLAIRKGGGGIEGRKRERESMLPCSHGDEMCDG